MGKIAPSGARPSASLQDLGHVHLSPAVSVELTEQIPVHDEARATGEALCWVLEVAGQARQQFQPQLDLGDPEEGGK